MDLRDLISFYRIAHLRSVSRAARKLELGQSNVTAHLRKLEDKFVLTFFDRIKRPIQLTSEGVTFLELVTPVLGAYPGLVMHHLPKAIQSFPDQYLEVRVQLWARLYSTLMQLVKSGEVDLAVCSRPPADDPSSEFLELFKYHTVLMTPPGHDLLQKHPIRLGDIAQWPPLILFGLASSTRRRWTGY